MDYATLQEDPRLLEALMRKARQERSAAVHRILVAPVRRAILSLFAPVELGACSKAASSKASASSLRAGGPA